MPQIREVMTYLGGNSNQVLLELLGGDLGNSVSGVFGWLKRQVVCEETGDVWGSHRGTGNGIDGVLAADPSGLDVETWGKDVVALAVVGEVSTLICESAGTNGYGLVGSCW